MSDLDFSPDELLRQARGNQSAIWYVAARFAREHASIDEWGDFVGQDFAPSWDELGDDVDAREVARLAALNIATTADLEPVELTGDATRAEVVIEGPSAEWTTGFGLSVEENDRINDRVFRAIAERRRMSFTLRREGDRARLTFEKVGHS